MKEKKLKVCWMSAGVSSFIAGYLEKDTIDKFIYIDIQDQHPDSMRFIRDCEKVLGKDIEILMSRYKSVENVCRAHRFFSGPTGGKCTQILKKRVRKEWEYHHTDYDITYVWGFDCDEIDRCLRLQDSMPEFCHEFPLIDRGLTKNDCHGICKRLGIKRPVMYDLGYNNNNCIGCLKGGKGYWNKIRVDFPGVFDSRSKLERELGHTILHDGTFLDSLDPKAGRNSKEILEDCGIACELALDRGV